MQQMMDKHPQGWEDMETEADHQPTAPPNMSEPDKVVREFVPQVGVGTRGFDPHYLQVLQRGIFADDDASNAFELFRELGALYLMGPLPDWANNALNSGLLTRLIKKATPKGVTPGALPTNAFATATSQRGERWPSEAQ